MRHGRLWRTGWTFPPADCYVVEDAYSGIDVGHAGGFTAIAIGDAAGCDKADIRIDKLSDILFE